MDEIDFSIVEYFGSSDSSDCGYCRGQNNGLRMTHGMWAHTMSIQVYQALIDNGWRRSGKYCYKPVMKQTCCPQYTIKCDVQANRLSKSQKNSLKRFFNFIEHGEKPKASAKVGENSASVSSPVVQNPKKLKETVRDSTKHDGKSKSKATKKRYQRYQRRVEKLRLKSMTDADIEEHFKKKREAKLTKQKPKQFQDYFNFTDAAKNKFAVKLIKSADASCFEPHKQTEFEVYRQYQTTIHKDKKKELTMKQFERFLVHSPLSYVSLGPLHEGGSFHQQYWLNDQLIAVGVIDILELCLSSVYLFYDPQYSFLSLGRISALYEIMFTRQIQESVDNFKYYYMGYYIHSCPKMRYKGDFAGSFLSCPETYTWHPIEDVKPLLDESKYARFASKDVSPSPPASLRDLLILYQQSAMPYFRYRELRATKNNKEEDKEILELCQLIGQKAAACKLILYRA